jgi:signal transduction histidine kinase
VAVEEKELVIEITDNGKGFEGGGAGHGLKNLPARLRKLNGTCAVESRLGGGTAVRIRVPLNGFREGAAANTTFD